jgi:RHS repeat-associated protein
MKSTPERFRLLTILFTVLTLGAIAVFTLTRVRTVEAQSCDNIPQGSGESITAAISVKDTGQPLSGTGLVPAGTFVDINAVATAFGQCIGMAWNCQQSPCVCQQTGFVYERTVNHIGVYVDISTNTSLNGTYFVGNVYGKNPNGTTADFHVLDTSAANSSGPLHSYLAYPGTYTFRIKAIINKTPCNIEPGETNEISITLSVGEDNKAPNSGVTSCQTNVGDPVNVTNGNMYLKQTDYRLPGIGEGLDITRTYNSSKQTSGLFGVGWSSSLDESVVAYGNLLVRLNLPDGRAVYFTRNSVGAPFDPLPSAFYGQIVKNVDNSYTLTYKDGSVHQFNANGKLTSFADPNGNTITLTLNASGNPTAITDASGRTVTLTYDSQSQIATISDNLGTIATYARLSFGRLSSVTYADGSKYQFTYVITGNNFYLSTVKDALNNVLESHTYDSQGRTLTSERANSTNRYTLTYVSATETDVTDALNRVTKYFFDTSKNRNVVTRVEGSCGCGNSQISQWAYDDQLNLVSKTDALNHTTSYTYDTNGNRLTQTDATGTITYTYNTIGQVLTMTDQMNGVWTNTYDAHGNRLTVKDPLNNTTTFTYNGVGQLLTITDPRNNTTTFSYNANGDLTQHTDALNNQTNIAYDARGRVTSITNALNQVTSYEYDLAGRLKKTIYPDTNFVLLTYDLAGRRTKIKDPRGYETTFAYDATYRLTSQTNADNKTTSYAYDLMSNLTGVTDALNRTTNYTYDDFNRLTKIQYPEATPGAGRLEHNFSYDLVGNLLTATDQAGRVTSYCYDIVNRLTSTIDPAQKTTAYEYNARSQKTAVVDAISQRYEITYDPLGRVTQEKKGTATKSFVYDAVGNRSQRTDFNGAVTNYTHDALNRLTTISYPDTTSATYGYDVLSRMTTATNPTGTVTIAYDNRGRVSSVTDVFGQVVGYTYDAGSNRTQLSLNAATNATYQYDVINRLTQLTDNASLNTTFAYDATNKLTSRTLPNGVVSTYEYDGLNRLTRLKHAKGLNTLADFQYQFSTANNITQMTDAAGAHNYTYDSLDRLTAATHPAGQTNESYTYDDVGNRTASHQGSSYTYQAFNRLVTANGTTFGYDTNGNLISKTDAGGSWTYSWDYEDRLKQASLSGGVVVNYSYDALGRHVQRTSTVSGTTRFVYDGADVVRDLDGSNATLANYLNGPGVDNKLRQTDAGGSSYYITDQFGTTRGTADASGNLISNVSYDSFGNVASGLATTRYTYTGREIDSDTSLMYYRARWFTSGQGRFTSEDPIGLRGGINLYTYVKNNPINFVDPFGLTRCNRLLGTLAGAAIGAGVGGLIGEAIPTGAGAVVGSAGGPGGTVVGAGVGAVAGIPLAYVGAAAGATIGGIAGYIYCSGDDAKAEPKAVPRCDPKPSPTPRKDKNCTLIAEIPVANNPALKTCVYACKAWRGSTINVVQYANLPCPEEDPFGIIPRPTIPGIWPPP